MNVGQTVGRTESAFRDGRSWIALRRWRRQPNLMVGMAVLVVVMAFAVAPGPFERFNPSRSQLALFNLPPSPTHWFGTDQLGRDIFSRVVDGTRTSLLMGLVPVIIGLFVGGSVGMLAGFYVRLGDLFIMRVVDVMMAFPGIILALTIVAGLGTRSGSNTAKAMAAIGVALIPTFARVTRGTVLSAKEQTYVAAARSIGCGDRRLMVRHILPNLVAPLTVISTLSIAGAILAGASLSFLGLGAQPPTIEWGAMINDGRQHLSEAWWIATIPGIGLMITVIAINLVGDGLRDLLDPRLRT